MQLQLTVALPWYGSECCVSCILSGWGEDAPSTSFLKCFDTLGLEVETEHCVPQYVQDEEFTSALMQV